MTVIRSADFKEPKVKHQIETRRERDPTDMNIMAEWAEEAALDPDARVKPQPNGEIVVWCFSPDTPGLDLGTYGRVLKLVLAPGPTTIDWIGRAATVVERAEAYEEYFKYR
ncbi:MAG TPA: hypothetical protein VGF22_05285, partial [Acidimicrobiales bacterium]